MHFLQPNLASLNRRPFDHISIENMYQDQRPYDRVDLSQDPVSNHGQQFRAWHHGHRKAMESVNLLGKVFRSWLSKEGDDASVPVNPAVISDLKRTSRLLHYCTSPLLIQRCLATPLSPQDGAWLDSVKEKLFLLYIDYMTSLGFQLINERSSSKLKPRPPHKSTTPPTSSLYKCLQRSWPGGIMMVEVMVQRLQLLVRLYTLEGSRLQQSSSLSPEVRSLFAKQCAHYKDFIHVHSFMHDFHLRLLLELVDGKSSCPEEFHLPEYLQLCHTHYSPPPSFAQNLLKKGELIAYNTSKFWGLSRNDRY